MVSLMSKLIGCLLVLVAAFVACESVTLQSEGEKVVFLPTVIAEAAENPPTAVWQPKPGTTWQWQLTGEIDTSFDVAMYDIDLFDTPQAVIETLHQDGRTVICYFSAGSYEDWRPDDSLPIGSGSKC